VTVHALVFDLINDNGRVKGVIGENIQFVMIEDPTA